MRLWLSAGVDFREEVWCPGYLSVVRLIVQGMASSDRLDYVCWSVSGS